MNALTRVAGWGQDLRRRILRDGLIALAGIIFLAFAAWWLLRTFSEERRFELSFSAGSASGLRHRFAEVLVKEAAARSVRLDLEPTAGSEAALDAVDAGQLDLALVQGGLNDKDRANIRQVATLHVEPLHLLVRPTLHDEVCESLSALAGRRINLSRPGSGTHELAGEVLQFSGLTSAEAGGDAGGDGVDESPSGTFEACTLSYAELLAIDNPAELPDAVFTVSSLPSPVVKALVQQWDYRLVPLPFARAFALDAFHDAEVQLGIVEADPSHVQNSHIHDATIPAYTYQVEPPVPDVAVPTLGTRLLLVANRNVREEAVKRLLDAVYDSPFKQAAIPALSSDLLSIATEYPAHSGMERFLRRNKPLIAGDVVEWLEQVVSIGGTAAGGFFFLYQWLARQRRRRADARYRRHISKVVEIERSALEVELSPHMQLEALLDLQKRLGEVKRDVLDEFAAGEFGDHADFATLVTQINGVRDYLVRLILHERDNVEEEEKQRGG